MGRLRPNKALVTVTWLIVFAVATNAVAAPAALARGASASALTCVADTEPNDTEDQVEPLTAPSCIDGTLPASDQDLFLWTIDDSQRGQRWTISLEGVRDTDTGLKILAISSDPGVTPIVAGSQLLAIDSGPESGRGEAADVMFTPGRYLLGISRSGTPDGGEPTTFDYHVRIAPGTETPPARDHEPNDDAKHGTPVSGAFSASGDLQGSDDYIAWTLSAQDANQRWHVSIQSEIGGNVALLLREANRRGAGSHLPR